MKKNCIFAIIYFVSYNKYAIFALYLHRCYMKTRQFCAELTAKGCFVIRSGSEHDIWKNPATGNIFAIPRHPSKELPKGLEYKARKVLGV